MEENTFIVTQNTQGFLAKAGFNMDEVWEIYGNVNYFQNDKGTIFKNSEYEFNDKDFKVPK